MSYADTLTQHRRLVILRFLAEQPSYTLNTSLLHDLVALDGAVPSSRDQIEAAVHWLAEQELVHVEAEWGGITRVVARQRGLDVAAGLARTPGVRSPKPQD